MLKILLIGFSILFTSNCLAGNKYDVLYNEQGSVSLLEHEALGGKTISTHVGISVTELDQQINNTLAAIKKGTSNFKGSVITRGSFNDAYEAEVYVNEVFKANEQEIYNWLDENIIASRSFTKKYPGRWIGACRSLDFSNPVNKIKALQCDCVRIILFKPKGFIKRDANRFKFTLKSAHPYMDEEKCK